MDVYGRDRSADHRRDALRRLLYRGVAARLLRGLVLACVGLEGVVQQRGIGAAHECH
jgi:hypothetical protein